jgi:hypothetical protein
MPELAHNMGLLVSLTEAQLRRMDAQLQHQQVRAHRSCGSTDSGSISFEMSCGCCCCTDVGDMHMSALRVALCGCGLCSTSRISIE